ncbi:MAG: cobalamin-binding protein [Planctomycetes bacterium]|nr:cobalamin-binding protein [Planctomycetota bacterium]
MKIVSLLPSATEIVCQLGLGDQLVGVTHECDYPSFVQQLPKVTKTLIPQGATSHEIDGLVRERLQTQAALYSLDLPVLQRLQPDLLVTQALCDVCAVSEAEVNAAACSLPGQPRVVNLEPQRLSEVFDGIRLVGDAVGIPDKATEVMAGLQRRVDRIAERNRKLAHRPRVLLLEWIDPPFTAGHWTPELVRIAGGVEVAGREGEPSRTMAWDEIVQFDPEFLIVACCGFNVERTMVDIPLLVQYPDYYEMTCVRRNQVFVIDGNSYFSRPGPRLVDALELLAHTLHPDRHPLPAGLEPPRLIRHVVQ